MSSVPDRELTRLLEEKFKDADRDFQSPCGYFYEADGPDFGYSAHTHHSDAVMTYFYLHGTAIGEMLGREESAWNDWLSYILLRQPDGSVFVIDRNGIIRYRDVRPLGLFRPKDDDIIAAIRKAQK